MSEEANPKYDFVAETPEEAQYIPKGTGDLSHILKKLGVGPQGNWSDVEGNKHGINYH